VSGAYGCFIELDDGLIGLAHRSKLEGFDPAPVTRSKWKFFT
jgi:hypothetical protein